MAGIDVKDLMLKISCLPHELKIEVEDFVDFQISKVTKRTEQKSEDRKFGSVKGMFTLLPGWDDPLDDEFKDYM